MTPPGAEALMQEEILAPEEVDLGDLALRGGDPMGTSEADSMKFLKSLLGPIKLGAGDDVNIPERARTSKFHWFQKVLYDFVHSIHTVYQSILACMRCA